MQLPVTASALLALGPRVGRAVRATPAARLLSAALLAYAWCDGRVRAGPFPAAAAVLATQAAVVAAAAAADAWGLALPSLRGRRPASARPRRPLADDGGAADDGAAAAASSSSSARPTPAAAAAGGGLGGLAALVPGLGEALESVGGWRQLLAALYADFGAFLLCAALLALLSRAGVVGPLLSLA